MNSCYVFSHLEFYIEVNIQKSKLECSSNLPTSPFPPANQFLPRSNFFTLLQILTPPAGYLLLYLHSIQPTTPNAQVTTWTVEKISSPSTSQS